MASSGVSTAHGSGLSTWREDLSYRRQGYRYFDHQRGMAGHLLIRLFGGKDLDGKLGFFGTTSAVNPYVLFEVNGRQARSSVVRNNRNPTWRREQVELPIPKTDLLLDKIPVDPKHPSSGVKSVLRLQVWSSTSVTKKVTGYVGLGGDELLGEAAIDITDIVCGDTEVFDEWVPLSRVKPLKLITAKECTELSLFRRGSGKTLSPSKKSMKDNGGSDDVIKKPSAATTEGGVGFVRIMLQYEPNGIEPRMNDVVNFEGYGLFPYTVLPPPDTLSLVVAAISGNYLLCRYRGGHGERGREKEWEGKIRIHRFKLFVVERQTCLDMVYHTAMRPIDYTLSTRAGKFVKEVVEPYVTVVQIMTAPVVATTKAMLFAAQRSSEAAIRAAFNY